MTTKTTYRVAREHNKVYYTSKVHLYREERMGTTVERVTEILPGASLRVVRHSPDGFEYGYDGSGPAQLALAILLDAAAEIAPMPELVADQFHQAFKAEFLVDQTNDEFTLDHADVRRWLAGKCAGAA